MSSPKEMIIDFDGENLFVIVDGVKIAKRDPEGSGTWISLVPGYTVRGTEQIEVEFDGKVRH